MVKRNNGVVIDANPNATRPQLICGGYSSTGTKLTGVPHWKHEWAAPLVQTNRDQKTNRPLSDVSLPEYVFPAGGTSGNCGDGYFD